MAIHFCNTRCVHTFEGPRNFLIPTTLPSETKVRGILGSLVKFGKSESLCDQAKGKCLRILTKRAFAHLAFLPDKYEGMSGLRTQNEKNM